MRAPLKKPYLAIKEDHYLYRIAWFLPEDGDFGGVVGDTGYSDEDLMTMPLEDADCVLAYLAVSKIDGIQRDGDGFRFDSISEARAALRVAKAAIKAGATGRPIPDWAQKALQEGWKAPRGWKP